MTYFRVDDKFWSHPKLYGVSLAARGLWVTAGSYCSSYLTDGFVAVEAVQFISIGSKKETDRCIKELTDAGLWMAVDGGWQFRDWADHNYSREHVMTERDRRKKNQSAYRARQQMKEMLGGNGIGKMPR